MTFPVGFPSPNNVANGVANGWKCIAAVEIPANGAAVIDLPFSPNFENFVIVGEAIAPSAAATLKAQFFANGNLDTANNYYGFAAGSIVTAVGVLTSVNNIGGGNLAYSGSFIMEVFAAQAVPASAAGRSHDVILRMASQTAGGTWGYDNVHGHNVNQGALSGIRLFPSSGIFLSGKIQCFGIQNKL